MLGVLLILCGYILGSVPIGLLVGRAFGVDVLEVGSGNIGMANVLRAAGKWPPALAAVVGACWSVFLRFKGGKGVATGAGTSIGLAPPIGLGLFVFWWVVVLLSRYTSAGAISVMILTPFV